MQDLSIVQYYNAPLSQFGFLSHVPVLTAACMTSTGPVLELGTGFGSTLVLHGICGVQKREILSLESDKTWLGAFNFYRRSWHIFKHVESFVNLPEYNDEWGLAFVDHGILNQRGLSLAALKNVPVVVAHDTCHERLNYHTDECPKPLGMFRYRFDYQWQGPKTSVLSNTVNVERIFKELGL